MVALSFGVQRARFILKFAQGVWTHVLARRAAGFVDHGRTTSQGRAARRASTSLLNHHRQIAGLTPVKLDRQLSAGCMEHANYMVQNQGTDAMAGLNPHTQGPRAAGAACAKAADLFLGVSDLGVAIDV